MHKNYPKSLQTIARLGCCALTVALSACGESTTDTPAIENEPIAEIPEQLMATEASRPNVVWILIDTLRRDHLSAYGYERKTSPQIDVLAERGVLFEQHFSQGPNTLESVPSYMSGKYFPVYLQDNYFYDVWSLKQQPDDEQFAPEIFKQNGYATAMFSASPWYTASSRLAEYFDHFGAITTAILQTTRDYQKQNSKIYDWITTHKDEAFFAYIHTLDAHEPHLGFNTSTEWIDPDFPRERDISLRFWSGGPFDEADQKHLRDLYDGGVTYADYTVSTFLRHLESLDLLDNTLVVISSDHGEILAPNGKTLGHPGTGYTDELFEVPLIMAGPGLPSGARFGQRTENVDIVPTLVDLLDLEHHAKFNGVSLVPLIEGRQNDELRSFVYSKSTHSFFRAEPRHVIRGDSTKWTFVETFADHTLKPRAQIESEQEAWNLPDRVSHRQAATPSAFGAPFAYFTETIAPDWIKYASLSDEIPSVFQVPHSDGFMEEVLTEEANPEDNLWTRLVRGSHDTLSTSAIYVAFNDTESAPRIANLRKVPPGHYTVSILATTIAVEGVQQATSFRVNMRNPEEFKLVRLEPTSPTTRTMDWIEIGDIDLSGGTFYYHIEPGQKGDVSAFGGFRFQDVNSEVEPEHDFERINEELDALGYLN